MRRLTPTLLSLCIHAPLILSGLPLSSFDAYTHLFFADHYRTRWFDLVELKWFGGFSVASYPPLTHQLIALLSMPASAFASLAGGTPNEIRFRGEVVGYGALLLIVLVCLPISVERFAAIFVPARAARTAGWLSVALPSVYLTAYSFGQLPTLAASVALLWALADGWQFCQRGRWRDLFSATLWTGVTAAAHHGVLLFAIIAGMAVAGWAIFAPPRTQRGQRGGAMNPLARFIVWAACGAAFGVTVIWPFIAWSRGYLPQTPIDHASRHNVFADPIALYYFFLPMYGPILLALPLAVRRARRLSMRRRWPLLLAAVLLFTLGLGGTTPLPRLLFGSNWEWLTYDRFSLWAGFALLPFAALLHHCCHRQRRGGALSITLGLALISFCLFAAFAAKLIHAQPAPLDVESLARFIDERTKGGERYLTFGFGDQMARLSVLTDARTIDGAYFTARAVPELRASGMGTLDGALWNPKGVWGILPFLARAQLWGVRWAFTAHEAYIPLLAQNGWENLGEIVPGVIAWRNPAPWVSTEWRAPVETDSRAALWWGIAPLFTLALASLAAFATRSLKHCSLLTVSLLIAAWPFWYHLPLWARDHSGVYFTYTSGMLFAADALAMVVVVLSFFLPPPLAASPPGARPMTLAFALIIAFSFASAPTSTDPILSLDFALHLCAMGAVAWAVARAMEWEAVARAMTVGLIIQSAVGLIEVATQSTAWLASMALPWPGELSAQTIGASVVGLANGARWLRAYGTLPHPNILAAYLLLVSTGPFAAYIRNGKMRWLLPLLFGWMVLLLTFSRAAWLADAVMLVCAGVLLPSASRRRWAVAVIGLTAVSVGVAAVLWPLFVTRFTADQNSPQESFSITDRKALADLAVTFIRARPLSGVGASAFVPTLAATQSLTPEPVHNVPLLAMAETGVGGGAAVVAFGLAILWRAWSRRGRSVAEAASAASVIGLMVMAMFDHFLWSLSAGRLLAALAVGLWLSVRNCSEHR